MADPTLTVAWLVLAHLLADFVFQTDRIAFAKAAPGFRAWYGLAAHGAVVATLLVPFALAFGVPGASVLLVTGVSHVIVDRSKILLSRRAEARALRVARRMHESPVSGILGTGWTPVPAALFVLDQVVHLAIAGLVWAIWLSGVAPTAGWREAVDGLLGAWDREVVHAVVLSAVVVSSLAIANIRGAAFFVEALVHPRQTAASMSGIPAEAHQLGGDSPPVAAPPLAPPRMPGSDVPPPRSVSTTLVTRPPSPERVGATIGVLERLLIVTFILTNNQVAIGFVIAAKTIARFKQLDDRDFAEYYLLGTLASVSAAIATGLLAAAALGTIPR
ncbi:MAG: DUF3307 domain-containing protein [Chloroflexota bacterium]